MKNCNGAAAACVFVVVAVLTACAALKAVNAYTRYRAGEAYWAQKADTFARERAAAYQAAEGDLGAIP